MRAFSVAAASALACHCTDRRYDEVSSAASDEEFAGAYLQHCNITPEIMRCAVYRNKGIRGIGIVGDRNADIGQPLLSEIPSVDGACLSLATSDVPTPPVKTICELFRPAFRVLPKTGDAEPVF